MASIVMSLISRKYLCTDHFCEVCISRLAWTVSCADILILIISLVDYFKEAVCDSLLLQGHAELVVGGRELHQGLLDPEGGVPHVTVLVPALAHQLCEPGHNLKEKLVD